MNVTSAVNSQRSRKVSKNAILCFYCALFLLYVRVKSGHRVVPGVVEFGVKLS